MIFKKKQDQIIALLEKKFIPGYSIVLQTDSIIIELESEDSILSDYIKRYHQFESNKVPDYHVRFYKHTPDIKWGLKENEGFIYGSIDFDEIFFYRQHKLRKQLDIVLPKVYKGWEIDNILKLYYSAVALNHNILLLHASAIIKDNKAILFFGKSGAGKSTISGLSGYPVLHDDILAISILEQNKYMLQTIPFKTNYEKKEFTGKIEGFYRIFQNNTTYIEEINKQQELAHVLFAVWNFNTFKLSTDKNNIDILTYCALLSEQIAVKNLHFSKTNEFLKLI